MKTADLPSFTELAYKYGPFFFALLFLVYLLGKFHKGYREATPGPKLRLFAGLLITTYAIGVGLVVVCVVSFVNRPSLHVFRGTIRGVQSQIEFDSDDAFFRDEFKRVMKGEENALKNVHFVAIQEQSFGPEQVVQVDISKGELRGERQRQHVNIPYCPGSAPAFKMGWDESSQKTLVTCSSAEPRHALLQLVPSAHASEPPAVELTGDRIRPAAAAPAPTAVRPSSLHPEAASLVAVLQGSAQSVGAKILVLDQLNRYEATGVAAIIRARTAIEPVAVTLLDLTRHSDPELSSKARQLLSKFDLVGDLVRQIRSAPPSSPAIRDASLILARLDPPQAQRVLREVGSIDKAKLVMVAPVVLQVARGEAAQPIATGTRQGDRYYVKAMWRPGDEAALKCLAANFNRELYSNRSLAQEEALMRDRKGTRVVFAAGESGKTWAVSIADEIRKCGARAQFVRPY